MPVEQRDPTVRNTFDNMGGRGAMTTTPITLQDLRRRIYAKAKAEPSWRFWGLYVHICKPEILHEAYQLAKADNGAPGVDGVTFEAIEASGLDAFLAQIRHELVTRTYHPMRLRQKAIRREGGKGPPILLFPSTRARVSQGPLKFFFSIFCPFFPANKIIPPIYNPLSPIKLQER